MALFELLADNENISAQVRWANEDPRCGAWRAIKNGFPEASIAAISRKSLAPGRKAPAARSTRQLLITLKGRAAARRHSPYGDRLQEPERPTVLLAAEGGGGMGMGAHRFAGAGQPDAMGCPATGGSEL